MRPKYFFRSPNHIYFRAQIILLGEHSFFNQSTFFHSVQILFIGARLIPVNTFFIILGTQIILPLLKSPNLQAKNNRPQYLCTQSIDVLLNKLRYTGGPRYSRSQYPRFCLFAIRFLFQNLVIHVYLRSVHRLIAIFLIFPPNLRLLPIFVTIFTLIFLNSRLF